MQIETKLHNMFSYSIIIVLPIIILITIILIFLYYKKKDNKKKETTIANQKELTIIKNKYLYNIQTITNNYNENIITKRKAYQNLSRLIRNFVYETTNIKVQYYTLKDINNLNIPILSELLEEYYTPEFERNSKGDIIKSINKTKKVIEEWK